MMSLEQLQNQIDAQLAAIAAQCERMEELERKEKRTPRGWLLCLPEDIATLPAAGRRGACPENECFQHTGASHQLSGVKR